MIESVSVVVKKRASAACKIIFLDYSDFDACLGEAGCSRDAANSRAYLRISGLMSGAEVALDEVTNNDSSLLPCLFRHRAVVVEKSTLWRRGWDVEGLYDASLMKHTSRF